MFGTGGFLESPLVCFDLAAVEVRQQDVVGEEVAVTARERLEADEDVAQHRQQHHLVLEAAPDLSQVNELRLKRD